jgi:hypothetical protein
MNAGPVTWRIEQKRVVNYEVFALGDDSEVGNLINLESTAAAANFHVGISGERAARARHTRFLFAICRRAGGRREGKGCDGWLAARIRMESLPSRAFLVKCSRMLLPVTKSR